MFLGRPAMQINDHMKLSSQYEFGQDDRETDI